MKRREFIIIVGGATMWPLAAQGQQPTGMRRIGVLMNFRSDVAEGKARVAAFMQALQKLGWKEATTFASISGGPQMISSSIANTLKNWLSSIRMSFLRPPARA